MPGNDDEYGAQFWYGYTYLWNDEQTDAELLDAAGLDREYTIKDAAAGGGTRTANVALPQPRRMHAVPHDGGQVRARRNTLQMNKDHDYGGAIANQLATLEHSASSRSRCRSRRRSCRGWSITATSRKTCICEPRAYLHANCAHCHRKWGGGNAEFQLQASLPLDETKSVNTPPGQGTFGLTDPRILVPGDPDRSLILHRMQLTAWAACRTSPRTSSIRRQ